MTTTQFMLVVATCYIAPHLPKTVGLAIGLGIVLGTTVQALL